MRPGFASCFVRIEGHGPATVVCDNKEEKMTDDDGIRSGGAKAVGLLALRDRVFFSHLLEDPEKALPLAENEAWIDYFKKFYFV